MITRFDPAQSMLGCNERMEEELIPVGGFTRRGLIQGSNMAFRRDCLEAIGIFDERFGAGTPLAGEEWDLALRASLAGWAGGYFPPPRVFHDHGRAGSTARERLLFYDYGGGAVYAKHSFGRGGLKVITGYLKELIRFRRDSGRIGALVGGYMHFHLTGSKARSG
jgi:hypothetical protein